MPENNKETLQSLLLAYGVREETVKKFADQLRKLKNREYCEILLLGIGNRGHAVKHIGLDNVELQARAQSRYHKVSLDKPFCASSFYRYSIVEIASLIKQVLLKRGNIETLADLLRGEIDKAELIREFPEPIGQGAFTGASRNHCYPLHKLCVVVKRGDYEPVYILTAYPEPNEKDLILPKRDIRWRLERERE